MISPRLEGVRQLEARGVEEDWIDAGKGVWACRKETPICKGGALRSKRPKAVTKESSQAARW